MAAFLNLDDLRRHAVPISVFADFGGGGPRGPVRPVASWQLDAVGQLICVWSLHETAPRDAPS